jgi:hypothetical protein
LTRGAVKRRIFGIKIHQQRRRLAERIDLLCQK